MLATQGDIATVGELRRLLGSLSGLNEDASVRWHVVLYDGPLTDKPLAQVLVGGDDVEVSVSAPVAPTAVTPDASWIAA